MNKHEKQSSTYNKRTNTNPTKAFTLIELIVVIVILSILATIAFLSFSSQSSSARDSSRLTDLGSVKKSMELLKISSGKYPSPDNGANITYSGGTIWTQGRIGDMIYRLLSRNISKKIVDPLNGKEYTYSLIANNKEYQLSADLENGLSYYIPRVSGLEAFAASFTGTFAYIDGNYNELVLSVSTGGSNYALAVPSLIVANIGIASNLVYDANFGSGKLQCKSVQYPCMIKYKSMLLSTLSSPTCNTNQLQNFAANLQIAYSGSNIPNINPLVQGILSSTGQATKIGSGLLMNNLGCSKIIALKQDGESCSSPGTAAHADDSCASSWCWSDGKCRTPVDGEMRDSDGGCDAGVPMSNGVGSCPSVLVEVYCAGEFGGSDSPAACY